MRVVDAGVDDTNFNALAIVALLVQTIDLGHDVRSEAFLGLTGCLDCFSRGTSIGLRWKVEVLNWIDGLDAWRTAHDVDICTLGQPDRDALEDLGVVPSEARLVLDTTIATLGQMLVESSVLILCTRGEEACAKRSGVLELNLEAWGKKVGMIKGQ